jgi:hypothetical protein
LEAVNEVVQREAFEDRDRFFYAMLRDLGIEKGRPFARSPSRTLFGNEALKAEVSSNSKGLQTNADGSVDVFFGPTAPSGKESNWVQTVPGRYWFPYFRLLAPTEAAFDRSWPLPDIEKA